MTDGLRGRLLVATPDLRDPNFFRTVVFVLEHSEQGALGVVLNRPSDTDVAGILPLWAAHANVPRVMFVGGPVSPTSVIGLARCGSSRAGLAPDARGGAEAETDPGTEAEVGAETTSYAPLFDGLATVDLDADPDEIPGLDAVRIFAGYAGWGAGQLDVEVASGGWIVVDSDVTDPFSPDASELWRMVLARQPGRVRMFALCPEDPRTN